MKKDTKKNKAGTNQPQTGKEVKKGMPVKNRATDAIKNSGVQMPGLNESKTTRDDQFPSDGGNLTR